MIINKILKWKLHQVDNKQMKHFFLRNSNHNEQQLVEKIVVIALLEKQ